MIKTIIFSFIFLALAVKPGFAQDSSNGEVRICVHNPDDKIDAWSINAAGDEKEFSYYPHPPVGYSCIVVATSDISLDVVLLKGKDTCIMPVMADKDVFLNLAQCEYRQKGMAIPKEFQTNAAADKGQALPTSVKAVKSPCADLPKVATTRQQVSCLRQNDFNSLDKDKDGTLLPKEMSKEYKDFSKLDKSKDGKVDVIEFMNFHDHELKGR